LKNAESISVFDTTFIVCDVETTGLSASLSRITEISLIKIYNGEFVDKFTTLINPQQHIPKEITRLTGITNEDVFNKPTFEQVSKEIISFVSDENSSNELKHFDMVFVGHNVSFDYKFLRESFYRMSEPVHFNITTLCTCKLARRLLRRLKSKSLLNVAAHLGISQRVKHRAFDDSYTTAKILIHFLELLHNDYDISTTEELLKFQNTKIYSEEKKSPALKRLKLNLKEIPKSSGVYFMKSRSDEVIYIGKAKNLKERLSSYFHYNSEFPAKVRKLIANIHNLEYETTNSELSALILESKLIKKYKPRFNSAIKRYRYHPFLKIDVQNDYPKVVKVYEIENDGANYYGPFSSGMTVNRLLKDINDKFRLRMCEDKYLKASKDHSTCMYLDISKCDAPCNYTMSKREYSEEVKKVHDYITKYEGNSAFENYKTLME
jgi:DNA polymerase-3 subunit epsilon